MISRTSQRDECRKRSTPLVLAPTRMYLFCSQAQKPVFCSISCGVPVRILEIGEGTPNYGSSAGAYTDAWVVTPEPQSGFVSQKRANRQAWPVRSPAKCDSQPNFDAG